MMPASIAQCRPILPTLKASGLPNAATVRISVSVKALGAEWRTFGVSDAQTLPVICLELYGFLRAYLLFLT